MYLVLIKTLLFNHVLIENNKLSDHQRITQFQGNIIRFTLSVSDYSDFTKNIEIVFKDEN